MAYAKINSITNANIGKVNNAAKATLGKIGGEDAPSTGLTNAKSIALDGANDYLAIGSINWDLYSIVFWFKTTSSTFSYPWAKDGGSYFALRLIGGASAFHMQHPSTSAQAETFSKDAHDGNWHMMTVTHSGGSGVESNTRLYLDGALEKSYTATYTYTNTTNCGSFGAKFDTGCGGPYNYWAGSLDEIGVWKDTVLDADAVAALYNSGAPIDLSSDSGNYDNSGDLDHWWRMGDGDTFATVTDNEGSTNLTMTNMGSEDIVEDVPS